MKEVKSKYLPVKNSSLGVVDAQKVGEVIERIMFYSKGEVTPQALVREALVPNSPINHLFEWDDVVAGGKFRLWQARKYIGGVAKVIIVNDEERNVRAFFNVKNSDNINVYVKLEKVLETPSYVKQLLDDCEGYVRHFLEVLQLLKSEMK